MALTVPNFWPWYFIENKNAIGPIVTELGKFTDFLSHEHKIIVISLFRCD